MRNKAEVAPILFEVLGLLLRFIIECFIVALGAILRVLAIALLWCLARTLRLISLPFLLLLYFAQECWRGPPEDDEANEPQDDASPKTCADGSYQAACNMLGLGGDFTKQSFNRAYRQLIKRAHPDAGGSEERAKQLNAARDLIRQRRGWANQGNLIMTISAKKTPPPGAFARALARLRKSGPGSGLPRLGWKHPAEDAEFVKYFTCAQEDEPFFIIWRRWPELKLLYRRGLLRLDDGLPPNIWDDYVYRELQPAALPVDVFTFIDVECPWCEAWGTFRSCACGRGLCGPVKDHRHAHGQCAGENGPLAPGGLLDGYLVPARDRPFDEKVDEQAFLRGLDPNFLR